MTASKGDRSDRIGGVVQRVRPLAMDETCGEAHRRFLENGDLLALAVVDAGKSPVGLVNRQDFFVRLADRYGWALFEKKPITALMDADPLIVDVAVSFDGLGELIVAERPSALLSGFVVTRNGCYAGVGTALSLLRMAVDRSRTREAELERARLKAVAASEAKSRFLANMSHELRTPLNAIIGFSDLMKRQVYGGIGNDRYEQYADDIHGSGIHLLKLINDILDLSKVEAGKLDPRREEVSLQQAVGGTLRLLRKMADDQAVNIGLQVPADLPTVQADPKMVRQILLNLVSNSLKFNRPGGSVLVSAAATPAGARIDVRDSGIGIEPGDIARAMEPFGQVDNGLNRRHDGTGLGLPLTRALVTAQGGDFRIDSRPGVGTTVTFTLPWAGAVADDNAVPRCATA